MDSDPDSAALPDSRGLNLFLADPGYAGLLGLYLPLALLALRHRLLPREPLELAHDDALAEALLPETPVAPAAVQALESRA